MYMNFNQVVRSYVFNVQMKRRRSKTIQCMVNAGTEGAARQFMASLGFNDNNCDINLQNC